MDALATTTVQIAQADVPNKNGRTYSKETLESAIKKFEDKPIFGMIGMPEITFREPTNKDETCVEFSSLHVPDEKISHKIENLRFDEQGYLIGDVTVLATPYGQILKTLLTEEVRTDFRTAGFAQMEERDGVTYVTDFQLTSINAVNDGA
jgi:hypothetical protein